jgi:hypothetical protein
VSVGALKDDLSSWIIRLSRRFCFRGTQLINSKVAGNAPEDGLGYLAPLFAGRVS